jgi:hypothetical protein
MFQFQTRNWRNPRLKKTHFLIENANEIVGWFLVQELQDITCVQKCEGSQWVCVRICTKQRNIVDTMFSKGALHLTQCTKLDKGNFKRLVLDLNFLTHHIPPFCVHISFKNKRTIAFILNTFSIVVNTTINNIIHIWKNLCELIL